MTDKVNATRLGLAWTELELALTFCRVAKDAANLERRARNIGNARTAYNAALKLLAASGNPVPLKVLALLGEAECELADLEAHPRLASAETKS